MDLASCGSRRRRAPQRAAWLLVLSLMVLSLLLSACSSGDDVAGGDIEPPDDQSEEPVADPGPEPERRDDVGDEDPGTGLPVPGPGEQIHPLTGLPVLANELIWRYTMVAIDNNPRARPQTGMPAADLVYELPVEGGLTRFLALYRAGRANPVGPVRSSRDYFLDLAMEWDAVYAHVGGSPMHYEQVGDTGLIILDDLRGAAGGGVFWRSSDRRAPHNLYTSTVNLRQKIDERNWHETPPDRKPFRFVTPDQLPEGEPARELVVFWPGHVREAVTYTYAEGSGAYLRYLGPDAHIDEASGEALQAVSILVQFVPSRQIPGDEAGRLDVDMVGEGRLMTVTGGQVTEGRWRKTGRREATAFLDAGGEPVQLLPGQVWVLVVPERTEVSTR
ncbi:MAG: DUF3048 domain-containing protein [Thermaerobacterales bacterium]